MSDDKGKSIDDLFDGAAKGKGKGKKAAAKPATKAAKGNSAPVNEGTARSDESPVKIDPAVSAKKEKAVDTVVIMLDEPQEGEHNYVFLGHNGKHYQLQRGVHVTIPRFLLNVLDSCEATRYTTVTNPETGQRELHPRKYLRFPYRLIKG